MITIRAKKNRTALSLVKEECPNYSQGVCLPYDRKCIQVNNPVLTCKYFTECVLPLDEALNAQIKRNFRKCPACGKPFLAILPKARRCFKCSKHSGGANT